MKTTRLKLSVLILTTTWLGVTVLGCTSTSRSVSKPPTTRASEAYGEYMHIDSQKITSRYEVFGKPYVVYSSARGFEQVGVASWYGPGFHGRTTANGEKYDMRKMSAAHKNLPFGTKLRVENLDNGRVIEVRINDRGPFHDGRVIDLSRKAADKIKMLKDGTARVRLTVVGEKRSAGRSRTSARPISQDWNTENLKPASAVGAAKKRLLTPEQAIATFRASAPEAQQQLSQWIQIGSYNERRYAEIIKEELDILGFSHQGQVRIVHHDDDRQGGQYKVRFKPNDNIETALEAIRLAGYYDAFPVAQNEVDR